MDLAGVILGRLANIPVVLIRRSSSTLSTPPAFGERLQGLTLAKAS